MVPSLGEGAAPQQETTMGKIRGTNRGDVVLVQLATRIPLPQHQAVRVRCVELDMTVIEFTEAAFARELERTAGAGEKARKAAKAATKKAGAKPKADAA